MDEIQKIIKKNKPNISDNSVRTYKSILKNLYMSVAKKLDYENMESFFQKEYKTVIEYLKDKFPHSTRKTKLAGILVLLGEKETDARKEYSKLMLKDIEEYNIDNEKQELTEKQKEKWKSQEEILEIVKKLKKKVNGLWKSPNKNDLMAIQDYIIASIYTQIPPRRLLDYTKFKLRKIDEEQDNYMDKNKFVFNQYKTKKKYDKQTVNVPNTLKNLINKWSKVHDNDYLLFEKNGKPLSQPSLNKRLNDIFGLSVNMLRSIYISNTLDMPRMKEIKNMSNDMGTSVEMSIGHYKKFK